MEYAFENEFDFMEYARFFVQTIGKHCIKKCLCGVPRKLMASKEYYACCLASLNC